MSYPYSNNDMKYDYATHRYTLTPECVLRELGLDLGTEANVAGNANPSAFALQALNKISRQVYNYIYETASDTAEWEKLLAVTPSVRDKLKRMMLAQLEYVSNAGYAPNTSGINRTTGQMMDVNLLRGRVKVADEVEQIANQTVAEWGVCMRYLGQFRGGYSPDWRW